MRKLFETRFGGLVFSLLSGLAYFGLIFGFILDNTNAHGAILGFFFFPTIVCGMALVLLKMIKRLREEENYTKINFIVIAHIILMVLSIIYTAARFIK